MEKQPRYAAYLKTTDSPTNWGFMAFIGEMKRRYLESTGRGGQYRGIMGHIDNHDKFTAFIESEVSNDKTTA